MASGNNKTVSLTFEAKNISARTFAEVSQQVDVLTKKLATQAEQAGSGEVTLRELNITLGKLRDAAAAYAAQSSLVESFEKQSKAVETAGQKATEASARLSKLIAAQASAGAATEKSTLALQKSTAAAISAGEKYNNLQIRYEATGAALRKLGADTENLGVFQAKAVAGIESVNEAMARGTLAVENFDAATRTYRANQKAIADEAKAQAAAQKQAQDQVTAQEREAADAREQLLANARAEATLENQQRDQTAAKAAQQREQAMANARAEATLENEQFDARKARLLEEARAEATAINQRIDAEKAAQFEAARTEATRINELRDEKASLQAKDQVYLARQRDIAARKEEKATTDALLASLQKEVDLENQRASQASGAAARASAHSPGPTSEAGAAGSALGGLAGSFNSQELQILGYRLKDIIDQLGAGSSITRVVAQQGAGIVADFGRQIAALSAFLPVLGAVAAAIGVLAAAGFRMHEATAALRQFNAELKVNADGANYQAAALVADEKVLQSLGASFSDAGKALGVFINAGLRSDELIRFGTVSQNLVRIYGGDLPAAAKEVTKAFTGNFAAVTELNEKYHFLTEAQNENIRSLFESGKSAEAQSEAFQLFQDSLKGAAEIAKGPFYEAFLSAKNAFNSFLDAVNNSGVLDRVARDLKSLADGAGAFADVVNGAIKGPSDAEKQADLQKQLVDAKAALAAQVSLGDRAYGSINPEELEKASKAVYDLQQKVLEGEDRIRASAQKTADEARAEEKKRLQAVSQEQKIRDDNYIHNRVLELDASVRTDTKSKEELARRRELDNAEPGTSESARNTVANEAAKVEGEKIGLVERRREEGIERELDSLYKQGDASLKDSLAARLDAVNHTYDAIYLKIQDLQKYGKSDVLGVPISRVKEIVEQQKALLTEQTTQKFYTEELASIESQRADTNKKIADDVKNGVITAEQGYRQAIIANDKLKNDTKDIAKNALTFAEALAKAKPGASTDAFLSKVKEAQPNAPNSRSTEGNEASGESLLNAEIERGNEIVKSRKDLQAALDEEVKKGILTQQQAEGILKKNYAETDSALADVIKQAEQLAKVLAAAGKDTSGLDLYISKLKLLEAGQKFVSESAQEEKKALQQAFTSDVISSVKSLTTEIGKLVAGQVNFKQATAEAGVILGQFVSKFLEDIAEIILKKQAEIAIQSVLDALDPAAAVVPTVGGLYHEGGIVGGVSNMSRRGVNPAIFAGAPRYHSGGVIGLQPNEQAAILKHGEEVLTGKDPRNVLNGGRDKGGSGPQLNIRHVLVVDPDMIPGAMTGAKGEQVTMSHIKANVPTLRQLLNVGARK
jgi:hypothetical protein